MTKSRQALRIQSGPSVVHKNHFFAQSFAQKETGSSLLHKSYFLPKALLRKKQALLIPTWSPTVVLTEPEDA